MDSPLLPWRWNFRLRISEENGITVIRSKLPQVFWRGFPGDATLARLVGRRALERYEELCGVPDIVHAHSVFPGIYTAINAAERWGIPYVLTEHRPSSLNRPLGIGRGRSIRKAVRTANGLSAVSTPFARKLADYYQTSSWKVIALPVPDSGAAQRLPELRPDSPFTFAHISYWSSNKRVKMTMRAFARVYHELPNVRMVFTGGKGKAMSDMLDLRETLGLTKVVELVGRKPREAIAQIMSQAHAFVLASAVEAGGTVFAEAQMAGLPCIGTKTFAGEFMIAPEAGIQVPIDDEDALVEAMLTMVRDRHRKFQPAKIRIQAKQRFSEATFVKTVNEFYQQAVNDYWR